MSEVIEVKKSTQKPSEDGEESTRGLEHQTPTAGSIEGRILKGAGDLNGTDSFFRNEMTHRHLFLGLGQGSFFPHDRRGSKKGPIAHPRLQHLFSTSQTSAGYEAIF